MIVDCYAKLKAGKLKQDDRKAINKTLRYLQAKQKSLTDKAHRNAAVPQDRISSDGIQPGS